MARPALIRDTHPLGSSQRARGGHQGAAGLDGGAGPDLGHVAGRDDERWGSRLEISLTDPRQEPDMSKWVTQLAFRLAD